MENQALGLGEALNSIVTVKRLHPRAPWKWLPPQWWPAPLRSPGPEGDALAPPWPDVLITCGKRAAAPSVAIRKASGGKTFTVHIQQPTISARHFDLVVVPEHDSLRGPNVFVTTAAVHRVTPARLAEAAYQISPQISALSNSRKSPVVAVLLGGSNNRHRLTPDLLHRLGEQLGQLVKEQAATLLITPSRRTGDENVETLKKGLGDAPATIWDGSGDNPYFAWLSAADFILVTCDSVSMTSEACSTGKPVYIIDLEGSSKRIDHFHHMLREKGLTRQFSGELDDWAYDPPDDTRRAADEILKRMQARSKRD
jgi:mitochondrial fission protein ELM1